MNREGQKKEVNPNSLIHGAWFAVGRGEKSYCRASWRLILNLRRKGGGVEWEGYCFYR